MCAYLTQLFITLGLQRVGATLGTALSYLTVVWGLVLGYLIFHEVCHAGWVHKANRLAPSRAQTLELPASAQSQPCCHTSRLGRH